MGVKKQFSTKHNREVWGYFMGLRGLPDLGG